MSSTWSALHFKNHELQGFTCARFFFVFYHRCRIKGSGRFICKFTYYSVWINRAFSTGWECMISIHKMNKKWLITYFAHNFISFVVLIFFIILFKRHSVIIELCWYWVQSSYSIPLSLNKAFEASDNFQVVRNRNFGNNESMVICSKSNEFEVAILRSSDGILNTKSYMCYRKYSFMDGADCIDRTKTTQIFFYELNDDCTQ